MRSTGGAFEIDIPAKVIPGKLRKKVATAQKGVLLDERYPYRRKLGRAVYNEEKALLQIELLKLQRWVREHGEKVVLVFEGRDAAGKGGTIKRFMEHLNPRSARVVALDKPTSKEQGQWYFQRYVEQLPTAGEIVFFDRSWYNRSGVEPVMNFCTPQQHKQFLDEAPQFERMLISNGIRLFKFWFSVSRAEQVRRVLSRSEDPLKRWKVSPVDVDSLGLWDDYTRVKVAMFAATDTPYAPWTIIKSDDKKRARINCMRHVLFNTGYNEKNSSVAKAPDPRIVGDVRHFGVD